MNCGMNPPLRRKANFKWADSVTVRPKAELLHSNHLFYNKVLTFHLVEALFYPYQEEKTERKLSFYLINGSKGIWSYEDQRSRAASGYHKKKYPFL